MNAPSPGRLVLLTTSHRVAPGQLSWPAWQALHQAKRDSLQQLRAAGADVRTGVSVTALDRDASGVTLTLDDGSTLQADEVLFATGRTPRT
ncbi:hypothetical protein ADL27_50530, partial [Streptomyces sp. NRRL F-6602]